MPRASLRWPLLLALIAPACRTAPPSGPDDAATEPAPGADVPPTSPAPPTPAAEPTHALELVPAHARVMMMARSAQRLAELTERERLVGQFPEPYAQLVATMQHELGHDLLDPSQLAAVGVDPTAPLGFALVDPTDEVVMVFGHTPDPAPLEAALQRVAREPVAERTVGPARLLRMDRTLTLVLRPGLFAMVLVGRMRDDQPDYAAEIARIDPGRSLAHAPAMTRGHAGLPASADLVGLLDVAGLVRDALQRDVRSAKVTISRAHQRLAEARQRGASPQELGELQRDLQAEEAFVARRHREHQLQEMMLSRTIGAIEGIGLAVDADARGLHGRIHVALAPDAMFRDLLRPSAQPPPALVALSDEPQWVVSGQVDVAVAVELLAQVLLVDGTTYAELDEELRRELHVDFDRRVRPRLTGHATLALTANDPGQPPKPADLEDMLGGVLAIGVDDEEAARAIVAEAVEASPQLRWTPAPELGGWSLKRPRAPRPLWVGVVAGQVVITSDRGVLERLRDGRPGTASRHYAHPDPWRWLTEGTSVARLGLHHRLPLAFLFSMVARLDRFDFPADIDFELQQELSVDVGAIPRGQAVRRLETQRDAATETVQALIERRNQEEDAAMWARSRALGITAGSVREVPSGLMIEGGHYVDGGMGRYIQTLVELSLAQDETTPSDAAIERAREERSRLEQRLLDARRREVKRALAERG